LGTYIITNFLAGFFTLLGAAESEGKKGKVRRAPFVLRNCLLVMFTGLDGFIPLPLEKLIIHSHTYVAGNNYRRGPCV
jgi:hypothetical protein